MVPPATSCKQRLVYFKDKGKSTTTAAFTLRIRALLAPHEAEGRLGEEDGYASDHSLVEFPKVNVQVKMHQKVQMANYVAKGDETTWPRRERSTMYAVYLRTPS